MDFHFFFSPQTNERVKKNGARWSFLECERGKKRWIPDSHWEKIKCKIDPDVIFMIKIK